MRKSDKIRLQGQASSRKTVWGADARNKRDGGSSCGPLPVVRQTVPAGQGQEEHPAVLLGAVQEQLLPPQGQGRPEPGRRQGRRQQDPPGHHQPPGGDHRIRVRRTTEDGPRKHQSEKNHPDAGRRSERTHGRRRTGHQQAQPIREDAELARLLPEDHGGLVEQEPRHDRTPRRGGRADQATLARAKGQGDSPAPVGRMDPRPRPGLPVQPEQPHEPVHAVRHIPGA